MEASGFLPLVPQAIRTVLSLVPFLHLPSNKCPLSLRTEQCWLHWAPEPHSTRVQLPACWSLLQATAEFPLLKIQGSVLQRAKLAVLQPLLHATCYHMLSSQIFTTILECLPIVQMKKLRPKKYHAQGGIQWEVAVPELQPRSARVSRPALHH